METLQETLGRYDADAALTSNLWMRYNALAAGVRDVLGIYERLMQSLPDDLRWHGLDRDNIAEAVAYGLTYPIKREFMSYVLSMMASFEVLPDDGEDVIRIGCICARSTKVSVIVTLKPFELDESVCVVTYEIIDPTFQRQDCNSAFGFDDIINRPKARLEVK